MSALANLPLFLYGFDIDAFNQYINFKASSGGPILSAQLNIGNYTATQFMTEIERAMNFADGANVYTVTVDRTINNGRSNKLTISSSGAFFSILFASGPNAGNTPATLMGFQNIDYTGSTHYTTNSNMGTILIPDLPTWNYLDADQMVENDGVKNVTSTGIKETLVFAQMQFFQGEWRYINNRNGNTQLTEWQNFLKYATRQLKFEFQPSINEDPTQFYQCTLETTTADSNGLKYKLDQMTNVSLFRFYQTGLMKFRVIVQ